MATPLEAAGAALARGEPILLYDADGREEETDMVVASQHATPDMVRRLRSDAGGLLCTVVAPEHHEALGLPFLADLVAEGGSRHPVLGELIANDIRYDASKSSFGITVNARRTFTGVTDHDRSQTIRDLARFVDEMDPSRPDLERKAFGRAFRSPGHVILLNAAAGGLARRQGHTELSLELARMAGVVPTTTICEMLDPASGRALGKKAAREYAERHGLAHLTGQDILHTWKAHPPHFPAAPEAPMAAPMSAS
ncbi:MAG: 3,4-dihydroxy-2-butanone-4-phosphate synthase [Thermoplasmatota archaeon]